MSPQLRGEALKAGIVERNPLDLIPPIGHQTLKAFDEAGRQPGIDPKALADSIPTVGGGYVGLEQTLQNTADEGGDRVTTLLASVELPSYEEHPQISHPAPGMTYIEFAMSLRSGQTHVPNPEVTDDGVLYPARKTCDGRYEGELYPEDSRSVMTGLLSTDSIPEARDTLDNLAREILTYGYPFNGIHLKGRKGPDGKDFPYNYFAGRTQIPPFFEMVDSLAARLGDEVYLQYQDAMVKYWNFFNAGAEELSQLPRDAYHAHRRRLVAPDGSPANRFYDDTNHGRALADYIPRLEAVGIDRDTAEEAASRAAPEDRLEVIAAHYLDRMAAAESAQDFSSGRWADGKDLSYLKTTRIVPTDLQCRMARAADVLSRSFEISRAQAERRGDMTAAALAHKKAVYFKNENIVRTKYINKYHWDPVSETYRDVEMVGRPLGRSFNEWRQTRAISVAAAYALQAGVSDKAQTMGVVRIIRDKLQGPGGFAITDTQTGEQWDDPNSWVGTDDVIIDGAMRSAVRFHDTPEAEELLEFAEEGRQDSLNGINGGYIRTGTIAEKKNARRPYASPTHGEYNDDPTGETHVNFSMVAEMAIALHGLDVRGRYKQLVEEQERREYADSF